MGCRAAPKQSKPICKLWEVRKPSWCEWNPWAFTLDHLGWGSWSWSPKHHSRGPKIPHPALANENWGTAAECTGKTPLNQQEELQEGKGWWELSSSHRIRMGGSFLPWAHLHYLGSCPPCPITPFLNPLASFTLKTKPVLTNFFY